jgi:hypothetical protein
MFFYSFLLHLHILVKVNIKPFCIKEMERKYLIYVETLWAIS